MEESTTDTMIIDEKVDALMVSPTGGDPFRKTAYFLKPIVPNTSIDEPPIKFPQCFSSLPSSFDLKKWPLKVEFRGWRQDHNDWKSWVHHLASIHQSTWKKAGIFEAIFSSTYLIKRKIDLVYGFAEKWCSETNSFIFPWGEATITLEDVMVLGGFSVVGDSVLSPLQTTELKEIEVKLEEGRMGLYNYAAGCKVVSTHLWKNKFMNSGSELEHLAFLVFWLSRYVFHDARNLVNKAVSSIAIHLARGTRIALAPAVLAGIYNDLSLLRSAIVASNDLKARNYVVKLMLKSPLHIVQVWAWERFLELRPKPYVISYAEPRLARWDQVDGLDVRNLRSVLDSAGEDFMWRPYAIAIENWKLPGYFLEEAKWVRVGHGLNDDELLSFAICLRVNQLVGFGTNSTIEQYLPHRVAMQFGFDQDIPYFNAPLTCKADITWKQYLKELENARLYIPSRLSEADTSKRYFKWWKESVAGLNHKSMPPKKKVRKVVEESNDATITCICSPKNPKELVQISAGRNIYEGNDSLVPPGFPTKRHRPEAGEPMDEDDLTLSEALRIREKHKTVETRKGSDREKLSVQDQILASLIADESSVNTTKSERLEKEVALSKVLTWGGKGKRKLKKVTRSKPRNQNNNGHGMVRIIGNECPSSSSSFVKREYASSSCLFEKMECASSSSSFEKRVSELKSRVNILEKVVEVLKAKTFGNNFTKH